MILENILRNLVSASHYSNENICLIQNISLKYCEVKICVSYQVFYLKTNLKSNPRTPSSLLFFLSSSSDLIQCGHCPGEDGLKASLPIFSDLAQI